MAYFCFLKKLNFCLDFDLHPMHNNIALLYFEEEFKIDSRIQPICLPKDAEELDRVSKEHCIGLGWGRDVSGNGGNNSVSKECMF